MPPGLRPGGSSPYRRPQLRTVAGATPSRAATAPTDSCAVPDLRACAPGGAGGVYLRSDPELDPGGVDRQRPGRGTRDPRRRHTDIRPPSYRSRRRGACRRRGGPRASRLGPDRPGRAPTAGPLGGAGDGRAPGSFCAVAGLGDRQAVAVGVRRRRPGPGRCPLVRPGDRTAERRAGSAAGTGQQHRQLELPDERAGARRTRPGPGRQRGDRENPVRADSTASPWPTH